MKRWLVLLAACAGPGGGGSRVLLAPHGEGAAAPQIRQVIVKSEQCGFENYQPGAFDYRLGMRDGDPGCIPHAIEDVQYAVDIGLRAAGYEPIQAFADHDTDQRLSQARHHDVEQMLRDDTAWLREIGIDGYATIDSAAVSRSALSKDIIMAVDLKLFDLDGKLAWRASCAVRSKESWPALAIGIDQAVRCAVSQIPELRGP